VLHPDVTAPGTTRGTTLGPSSPIDAVIDVLFCHRIEDVHTDVHWQQPELARLLHDPLLQPPR
jgi:hypothetical protein